MLQALLLVEKVTCTACMTEKSESHGCKFNEKERLPATCATQCDPGNSGRVKVPDEGASISSMIQSFMIKHTTF